MKNRKHFAIVAAVLLSIPFTIQVFALDSVSEGGLMPSEIGQTNDETLMKALANPDLTAEQKRQLQEKYALADRLATEEFPSTFGGTTALLNVDPVMQGGQYQMRSCDCTADF